MGLDVCVFEFVKIPDDVNTEKELDVFCQKNGWEYQTLDPDNEFDKKLPREYVKSIPMEVEDWETTFSNFGLNYKDYAWVQTRYDTVSFAPVDENGEADYTGLRDAWIQFTDKDIVRKTENIDVIVTGDEVGYQRKGANAQFYDDGKWNDNTWVVTKEELIDDWNKYFSDPNNEYYGKNARDHFKKHIIDKFVEGKTFVLYC